MPSELRSTSMWIINDAMGKHSRVFGLLSFKSDGMSLSLKGLFYGGVGRSTTLKIWLLTTFWKSSEDHKSCSKKHLSTTVSSAHPKFHGPHPCEEFSFELISRFLPLFSTLTGVGRGHRTNYRQVCIRVFLVNITWVLVPPNIIYTGVSREGWTALTPKSSAA
ncbi:hypothetical protein NPIL_596031 [Nephila pilipes]|uniref:Uncharacterized protein n=1 Tax=Nephila pilipes TaxID=299642 RepID=A0A8X6R3M9_NEPPI|nr:hypothetical protein NPIL_596031 [Nephila pilipes]